MMFSCLSLYRGPEEVALMVLSAFLSTVFVAVSFVPAYDHPMQETPADLLLGSCFLIQTPFLQGKSWF